MHQLSPSRNDGSVKIPNDDNTHRKTTCLKAWKKPHRPVTKTTTCAPVILNATRTWIDASLLDSQGYLQIGRPTDRMSKLGSAENRGSIMTQKKVTNWETGQTFVVWLNRDRPPYPPPSLSRSPPPPNSFSSRDFPALSQALAAEKTIDTGKYR